LKTKAEPCVICDKPTRRFLFSDKLLAIHLCSKKCEYMYLNELSPDTKQQAHVLMFLDKSILTYRKYNKVGWIISSAGFVGVVLGFVFASAFSFIVGATISTVGVFSTKYFEGKIYELTKTRKRIEI
jgi:hypothetical protein